MSSQPGIDYESLLLRLHGGLCELKNLREHRRQRSANIASEPSVQPPPPAPPTPSSMEAFGEMPVPQGYVTVGGRLVPFFGEVQVRSAPNASPTPLAAPGTPTVEPFSPPPPPPAPTFEARPPPAPSRPPGAAVLNLPPPTPPARLNLVTTPTPVVAGEGTTRAESPPKQDQTGDGPHRHVPMAALEAMLQRRSDAEAQRLEQVHAEHRAVLATLLDDHRVRLQNHADAEAARQAEQRMQLSQALEMHADLIRQLLTQHRDDMRDPLSTTEAATRGDTVTIASLSRTLAEQTQTQRDLQEQTTQQISNLTAAIGEIGQTVGLLAVATFDNKRHGSPALASPTFLPPPRRPSPPPPVAPDATPSPIQPRMPSPEPTIIEPPLSDISAPTAAPPMNVPPATPAVVPANPQGKSAPISQDRAEGYGPLHERGHVGATLRELDDPRLPQSVDSGPSPFRSPTRLHDAEEAP